MMWDQSTIYTNKYNEEINCFYKNLMKNQKLFDKFVTYIQNVRNNYEEKPSFVDFIAGMETSYFVFTTELEKLNTHVASATGSLRKFSQITEPNQANCEWNDLSKQIFTLIELLNKFLNNTPNINVATSNKCAQNKSMHSPVEPHSKLNSFDQTSSFGQNGTSSYLLNRASRLNQESTESQILDLAIQEDQNCGNVDTPQAVGPFRRKRMRYTTSCCSCGKLKLANKSTQTATDHKNRKEGSICCCCKEDSKAQKRKNGNGDWVTVYEVQTQTLVETNASHATRPIADSFIQKTEPSYYLPKNPTSSTISPTPYGVSSNSLPLQDQKSPCYNPIPMEDNIKLLLKLLEEIEKSLHVVKQLHETLIVQTGYEAKTKLECDQVSVNPLELKNKDINVHLTVTLESNSLENEHNLETQSWNTPDRKSITSNLLTSGNRLSNFFKRKNGDLSVKNNSIRDDSIIKDSDATLHLQGDIDSNRDKSATIQDSGLLSSNRKSSNLNITTNDSYIESTQQITSQMGSSFHQSSRDTDNNHDKSETVNNSESLHSNRKSLNQNMAKNDSHIKSSSQITTTNNRRSSFKRSIYENDPNLTNCLFHNDNDCKSGIDSRFKNLIFQNSLLDNYQNLENLQHNLHEDSKIRRSTSKPSSFVPDVEESKINVENATNNYNENLIQHSSVKERQKKIESTSRQGNISKRCHCCDIDHNFSTQDNYQNLENLQHNLHEDSNIRRNSNKRSSLEPDLEENKTDFENATNNYNENLIQSSSVKERQKIYESTSRQGNISKRCHCCDNDHNSSTQENNFNQVVDTFRCPTCQHRCVYCKSCFEMHETLYNCLKTTREEKPDHQIRPDASNTTPLRDDKNFWAEAMLYFMPNFLSSLKKGTHPTNLNNIKNENLIGNSKGLQVNQKETATLSVPSSPECDRKPKYKWVLIRVEYFEDGTRQINLINDTDIPENSYLTASK